MTLPRRTAAKEAINPLDADGAACYCCNHFVGSAVGIHSVAGCRHGQCRSDGERASRLLAMALSARDKGQIEYADKLTKQASDVLDEATKAQATAIQPAKDPQPAAQQQQQQQPKKE